MAHSDVPLSFASLRERRLLLSLIGLAIACASSDPLWAAGTQAGTLIENTARASFDINGAALSINSNTVSIAVDERIDLELTSLTPQVLVAPADEDRGLLLRLTNTGNGSEQFALNFDSALVGDDFDPLPGNPAVFFDTDGSGDFSLGDLAYVPGNNDPLLAPDESVDVLLVNDMPANIVDGQLGRSELTATALTGSGVPGDSFPNRGDGGGDALLGSSGGAATAVGEYGVADVQLDVVKSVLVTDPFGAADPVPGATLTYTVTVAVMNGGTATDSIFSDRIPENTRYVPSTISLNGGGLTDAAADDAGELDSTGVPTVVVRLGDLTQADGVQTVSFDVVID